MRTWHFQFSCSHFVLGVMGVLTCLSACSARFDARFDYRAFFNEHGTDLQDEYRIPTGSDLSYWGSDPETVFYRTTDDNGVEKPPYWTKGDFNQDGALDVAYLLFRGSSEVSAFVFLSLPGGTYYPVSLSPASDTMGLDTVSVTQEGTTRDGLKLFEFEGGFSRCFVWSSELSRFVDCGPPSP